MQYNKSKFISSVKHKLHRGRMSPVLMSIWLVVFISMITRVALLIKTGSGFDYTIKNITGVFIIGLIYDLAMSCYLIIPILMQIWLTNEFIYNRRLKWIFGGLATIIILVYFFSNIVPADFNRQLKNGVGIYLILRLSIFLFLANKSIEYRKKWRTGVLYLDFFLIIFLLLFNAVSEWFFWDEFSVRYNFIAVDYLVYTNEVLGNIKESYPLPTIISILLVLSALIFISIKKKIKNSVYDTSSFKSRTIYSITILFFCGLSHYIVRENWRKFSTNEFANQLAGNGIYQFGNAFWNNELDFYKFYTTLPDSTAFRIVKEDLNTPNSRFISKDLFSIDREIHYTESEKRYNVVLITVESLSAEFMKAFGNTQNITPFLDSLAGKSLFFKNLYASGTRTVRGLEALSLGLPPSPGQSIVKRPDNGNLFSLGSVFKSKGYITQYIYGGYSYFDNMKTFFGGNDYEVIDRDAIPQNEIHYQNIWGVADEDLFTLAGKTLDNNYAKGKPFFSQIMTVSNHRPFTYPAGRIDIHPSSQSREGGVKYTDYAINRFLIESSKKPWFDSTIFIIVADHCAGSAGNVELPVTGYHIPMLIYAPHIFTTSKSIDRLVAQIDIAPTILGLLHFNYKSKFLGKDILNYPETKEKAFISTYQGLGYIEENKLIIQSPVKKITQFIPDFLSGKATQVDIDSVLMKKGIAYYQVANWLIKNKKFNKID